MSERDWKWFKHGKQFDVRCNAIAANGMKAKPCIVVFVENKDDVYTAAVDELKKCGYTNITVDKVMAR